ncbi:O-antigen ligase family protein [Actinopolymorpha pittospori]|uniref:O-antigen ligase n=1 Tax=Actinopolymorpha pittospori TaxID=648752 RepID=A0A927RPT4_9ACTN|nr:O-antigen ligase family protein [Actinopolymorpha pittospori]MBE1612451.1 O-antigen ligase [Actinopolymorpha pittospori]
MKVSLWGLGALASAALGTLAVVILQVGSGLLPPLLVGAVISFLTFLVWPWSVLPAGILGGYLAAGALAGHNLAVIVIIHAGIVLTGALAILVRRLLSPDSERRFKTVADIPMLVLAAVIVAGACYGLARGNEPYEVVVATYQLAVIPGYFFLATYSLGTVRRLRLAGTVFILGTVGLATAALPGLGGHVSLFSAMILPTLLVIVSTVGTWMRAAIVAAVVVLVIDIMLAGYRAVWLASAVVLAIILLRGSARLRRGVVTALGISALVILGSAAFSTDIQRQSTFLTEKLASSPGYRGPEASVGLSVFFDSPFAGQGLGQTTPDVYLPTFQVTDVGPVYHVFWVGILANLGLVGILALAWPLVVAVIAGLRARRDHSTAMTALTCGFVIAATFAGPTDGHWDLGLMPALILLVTQVGANRNTTPAKEVPPCSSNPRTETARPPDWVPLPSWSPTTRPTTSPRA